MTLEASLPYVSIAAAIGAGALAGRARAGSAEPALRALALAALGMFAYFRGVTPSAIAQALTLGAIANALLPRGPGRFRNAGILFMAAAWLVFGYLFLRTGAGHAVFIAQPLRALALVLLLAALGWRLAGLHASPQIRAGALADLGAAAAAAAASLTLPWGAWPAMAGALVALIGEALPLAALTPGGAPDGALARRIAWTLSFLGQASMAYAFLK